MSFTLPLCLSYSIHIPHYFYHHLFFLSHTPDHTLQCTTDVSRLYIPSRSHYRISFSPLLIPLHRLFPFCTSLSPALHNTPVSSFTCMPRSSPLPSFTFPSYSSPSVYLSYPLTHPPLFHTCSLFHLLPLSPFSLFLSFLVFNNVALIFFLFQTFPMPYTLIFTWSCHHLSSYDHLTPVHPLTSSPPIPPHRSRISSSPLHTTSPHLTPFCLSSFPFLPNPLLSCLPLLIPSLHHSLLPTYLHQRFPAPPLSSHPLPSPPPFPPPHPSFFLPIYIGRSSPPIIFSTPSHHPPPLSSHSNPTFLFHLSHQPPSLQTPLLVPFPSLPPPPFPSISLPPPLLSHTHTHTHRFILSPGQLIPP